MFLKVLFWLLMLFSAFNITVGRVREGESDPHPSGVVSQRKVRIASLLHNSWLVQKGTVDDADVKIGHTKDFEKASLFWWYLFDQRSARKGSAPKFALRAADDFGRQFVSVDKRSGCAGNTIDIHTSLKTTTFTVRTVLSLKGDGYPLANKYLSVKRPNAIRVDAVARGEHERFIVIHAGRDKDPIYHHMRDRRSWPGHVLTSSMGTLVKTWSDIQLMALNGKYLSFLENPDELKSDMYLEEEKGNVVNLFTLKLWNKTSINDVYWTLSSEISSDEHVMALMDGRVKKTIEEIQATRFHAETEFVLEFEPGQFLTAHGDTTCELCETCRQDPNDESILPLTGEITPISRMQLFDFQIVE